MVAASALLGAIWDMLFPARCAGCGWRGAWLCPACAQALPKLAPPVCRYCGRPTAGVSTCSDCWKRRPALDGVTSPYYFEGPVRTLIHRFKYRRARHLAPSLVDLLLRAVVPPDSVDVLVPVPLHEKRLRQRGYNQAALLAAEIAKTTGIAVDDVSLRRIVDTPPQMGLPAAERRRNVRNAFACTGRELNGRRVLLVDDVCTTGATLDACARAIKRGGAVRALGLTVARAR